MLNKIGVNIMTLEDPVENQVDGISQSQVKPTI
jgi:type II secretory ATPase GspE/PulE/Tfp pilus assembly ATPase PilB-like protein